MTSKELKMVIPGDTVCILTKGVDRGKMATVLSVNGNMLMVFAPNGVVYEKYNWAVDGTYYKQISYHCLKWITH